MIRRKVIFCVPGPPVGKQRPRFDPRSRRVYTSSKTAGYENLVAMHARVAQTPRFPGPVRVTVALYMPDALRRDIDNAVKSITDALNEIAWGDDSQIVELHASKSVDRKNPRAVVTIEAVDAEAAA